MLAGELSGRQVPHERRSDARDLVGRDLLTVPGAAEDNAERFHAGCLIGDNCLSSADAEGRIVVERVVHDRTVVDHLVPGIAQVPLQVRGELETSVVCGDVDAHAHHPRSEDSDSTSKSPVRGRCRRPPA